ncbi:hypothetical protein [Paenisporosarcina sp. TG20]|uniref:phage integrase SAM-like domain-containing protein n=1 Tax=Paenisporosarcina sp. TG20 TaxID=1211706 RepID=UPI0003176218|nr:hypothetical protein [Paenisporosarcina sp. TG20]
MTKKVGIFDVSINTEILKTKKVAPKEMTVEKALSIVHQQMKLNGYRERTLNDYNLIFNQFAEAVKIQYLEDINVNSIYKWFESMNVSQSTKSTRLKCLKAVLRKCYNNGWYQSKFWLTVQIKLDKKVKQGVPPVVFLVFLSNWRVLCN